jgi:periplasmic protein TonB
MRRDLIIGIILSALLHGGVFYGDQIIKFKPKPPPPKEEAPKIEVIEMPKLEPEEPEKIENNDEPVKPLDFAPPMQTDVPQVVTDNSFVQKIQPPPPENITPAAGVITIPTDRDPNRFRGVEIFDLSKLDQAPVARSRALPVFPYEMRRAGIKGEVIVDFIVDSNGDVQDAFASSSTQREFEAAAVAAVSKWKFKAGRKGGRDVNTKMRVPIVFSLNDQ